MWSWLKMNQVIEALNISLCRDIYLIKLHYNVLANCPSLGRALPSNPLQPLNQWFFNLVSCDWPGWYSAVTDSSPWISGSWILWGVTDSPPLTSSSPWIIGSWILYSPPELSRHYPLHASADNLINQPRPQTDSFIFQPLSAGRKEGWQEGWLLKLQIQCQHNNRPMSAWNQEQILNPQVYVSIEQICTSVSGSWIFCQIKPWLS